MTQKTKTPALIDRHLHGGYGVNFNDCTIDEVLELCCKLPAHGLGTIYPTIMTDDAQKICHQTDIISQARKKLEKGSTKIGGIHLEGPFINSQKKGIHPQDKILEPTVENFNKLIPPSLQKEIKIVTLAPELDKNLELTKYLQSLEIVVSIGHTMSNGSELGALNQVTHFFNAMPSLHHRNLNITSKALMNDNVFLEIIGDHFHIDPLMLEMIFKIKPKEKLIFVSDALSAAYSKEEKISFGGEEIFIKDNTARDALGTIAGATKYLDEIIRLNVKNGLLSFEEALDCCSNNVAASLCLELNNDFIEWDEHLRVVSANIE